MQTRTAVKPFMRIRPATVYAGLVFAISVAAAMYCWREANLPMTEERYSALCDNLPECYPEAGYLFGSVVAGAVAFVLGTCLLLLGLINLLKSLFQHPGSC